MPAGFETKLRVNSIPVELNEYAHMYITRIVLCAVSMLKGGEDVRTLVFALEGDKPSLTVNEKDVPLIAFPKEALAGTFRGMVSSLRGIREVDSLNIEIKQV